MRPILALALALALALIPVSAAHGGPPPSYDPLILNIDGFLTKDGKIQRTAPENGEVCFGQATPATPGAPLKFVEPVPVTFSPQGMHIIIAFKAEQAVATQDANQKSIQVDVLVDGKPVDGMSLTWPAAAPVMQPGTFDRIDAVLASKSNVTFPEGAALTLQLTPLMPILADGALCVESGESNSIADFPFAQVPTVYDLHVNDPALQQYDMVTQNATYADGTLATNDIEVFHDRIQTNLINFLTDAAYINMKGAELSTDAEQYHAFADLPQRLNATHDFLVAGTFVRVHPGMATVVLVNLTKVPASQRYLACIRNCPQPLNMTLLPYHSEQSPTSHGQDLLASQTNPTPTVSTNVVQKQDTTEKRAPGTQVIGVVLAAAVVAIARRR